MNSKHELQRIKDAKLPRMSWRDVLIVKEGETLPEVDEKALSEYFAHFVKTEGGKCVCCGARQGSKDVMDAFLGGGKFTWGIAHGEGFCSVCNWPARAYHFNVGPIERFEMILQYHPDELNVREEKAA
jgi:hypothetical protein